MSAFVAQPDRPNLLLVTAADAAEDVQFFADNPRRNYHIERRFVTHRRGADTFLRTPIPPGVHTDDSEGAAEICRWQCSWPQLSREAQVEMAKRARRRGSSSGRKG